MHLKTSKTDPFRSGMNVHIGRTTNALCLVAALLRYLSARGSKPGLLFHFHNGSPLTKRKFTSQFRKSLMSQGIDSSLYAGHSFKIGAATTASLGGLLNTNAPALEKLCISHVYSYSPQKPCCRELRKRAHAELQVGPDCAILHAFLACVLYIRLHLTLA